ncbi:MAG: quinone-interacting membrane-bound oxidoreductase complex subunit QmoC [Nitrospira sp.]|nr:quinone-interacting membrane-bound oxidoreductase complex subunit QmoC [bacterium]MBL7050019.1 quinone-interacting membrane-bound oxidoreductase complex subunit QmoC [Nitrospira sp.]
MAEQVIKPDLDFVKGVMASGGESLKKCYQCATCSVVCNVTPDDHPFPRKEMVWAQWGLKEKFVGNPDVWLCHQCNDCTAYCPRGAQPGEVLGAIRKQGIKEYAAVSFLSDLVGDKSKVALLFAIPAILVALVISMAGNWAPEGDVIFSKFMPIITIQMLFTPALLFGVVVAFLGVKKFWTDMKQANGVSSGDLKGSIIAALTEIVSHKKFQTCDVSKDRYISHGLVFFSFVALFITTAIGAVYIDVLHMESPFYLGYGTPVKILGNAGAIAIIAGVVLMMSNRLKNEATLGKGSYFDWMLLSLILTIGLSGLLAELTRVAGIGTMAYPIYFIHLVSVLALFLYLPYSKLAHMFYRTAAISFIKYSGRDSQSPEVAAAVSAVATGEPAEEEQTKTEQSS